MPREFHPTFAAEPFRCADSGTDFAPAALDEHAAYVRRWGTALGGSMLLRLYFGHFTIPHLDELFDAIDAQVADADLVISHPAAAVVASMSTERRGVPLLVGDLFPMLLLSEHQPIAGAPYLGRRVNRVLIRTARSRLGDPLSSGKDFRAFRTKLGLSNDGWNVVDGRLSPGSNLGLVPAAYVAPQPDWPANYRLVGFTPWAGPDDGRLDPELAAFLDAGDPPVVITLGTSAASARPEVFTAALAALDRAGARGVVLGSNDEIAAHLRGVAGDRHLVRTFAPLEPLLARSRAIVHSGAHGTNSLALLAGVPSVIDPCLFDQVWHARRQHELDTGIHVRKPSALADALARVLDPAAGYADRAAAFARRIGPDDGVTATADEAERLLAG